MSSLAACVLCASTLLGQAEAEKATMPAELRQQIDANVIGQWTYEGTWGDEKFSGEESIRWVAHKTGILIAGKFMMGGKRMDYVMLQGWDGAAKTLLGRGFSSEGETSTSRWTGFSKEKWLGHGEGIYQGKKWDSDATLEFHDGYTRYEDVTQGKPWVAVYKRKPESAKAEK